MPSNHTTHVCVPCRNVIGWGPCPECGEPRVLKNRWSAPRKNNDRAWKRIEKGEWLWDRRRVRRNPPNAAYDKSSWVRLPNYKKGQRPHHFGNTATKHGPDVDMGG